MASYSYNDIKWKLSGRHTEHLDKIDFLEEELHKKDARIKELERLLQMKCPSLMPNPEPAEHPKKQELSQLHRIAKELLHQGKHSEAAQVAKKIKIHIALAEARSATLHDLNHARQKLLIAEQLLADSDLPAKEHRKVKLEIDEIKTIIKLR